MHQNSTRAGEIVPILSLADVRSGIRQLERVFGFRVDSEASNTGAFLVLGDQRIQVVEKVSIAGALDVHHLALSVRDTDSAMQECLSRGGLLARSMTPDGPLELPEFWEGGVRYVFFEGPEGALIELCMKKNDSNAASWGHGHIGVKCLNVAATQRVFEANGCSAIKHYSLDRPTGRTMVTFLSFGTSTVELFCEPQRGIGTTAPAAGWVGCCLFHA